MDTIYGDRSGRVTAIGETLPQPWRCEYTDENGRCKNDNVKGSRYCKPHKIIIEQAGSSGQETVVPAET